MTTESQANMAKFSVNVPDQIGEDLQRWADEEGRPRANLAAFLIELAVRQKYPDKYPPDKLVKTTDAMVGK
jgi:CopG-like RHH_1 or ribbon-helix-helix domain, RHH_5